MGKKIFDEVKLNLDASEGKYEPFNVGNERSLTANYTVVRKWPDPREMVELLYLLSACKVKQKVRKRK